MKIEKGMRFRVIKTGEIGNTHVITRVGSIVEIIGVSEFLSEFMDIETHHYGLIENDKIEEYFKLL